MQATLNLQFTPTVGLDELPATTSNFSTTEGSGASNFTELMRLRIDSALASEQLSGDFLPSGGSELPLQSQVILPPPHAGDGVLAKLTPNSVNDASELGAVVNVAAPDGGEVTPVPLLDGAVDATIRGRDAAELLTAPGTGMAATKKPLPPVTYVIRPGLLTQPQLIATHSGDTPDVLPPVYSQYFDPIQSPPVSVSGVAATLGDNANDARQLLPRADGAPFVRVLAPTDVSESRASSQTLQQATTLSLVSPAQHALPVHGQPQVSNDPLQATAAGSLSTLIETPVRDASWGERISERVLTMVSGQLKTAEIRLTPAELGPVRVQVSIDDGAANVTFHAQQSLTRDAIEQALPRLREMLAENGLSLGQANVGEQGSAEGNRDQSSKNTEMTRTTDDLSGDAVNEDSTMRPQVVSADSLVDTFA